MFALAARAFNCNFLHGFPEPETEITEMSRVFLFLIYKQLFKTETLMGYNERQYL